MFEISKEFRFEAAHHLPLHDGKCRRVHGHSWVGRVILRSPQLIGAGPKSGMVQDFGDVKEHLTLIIDHYLDHYDLNETTMLPAPTSEALAEWIFYRLECVLPLLVAVEIEETCTSKARFERNA